MLFLISFAICNVLSVAVRSVKIKKLELKLDSIFSLASRFGLIFIGIIASHSRVMKKTTKHINSEDSTSSVIVTNYDA